MARGLLFVISGPSGVGKNSVLNRVLKERNDIFYSISATTRPPRRNEVNGKDYYFLAKDEFEKAIESGGLLEWALVYDNYYGTPRKAVEERLNKGQHVIMDLDTQGAARVRNNLPEAVLIFLLPPSREELKRRLLARKSEAKAAVERRLACFDNELAAIDRYNYVVVNDLLENACRKVTAIITAEEARVDRGYWREIFWT